MNNFSIRDLDELRAKVVNLISGIIVYIKCQIAFKERTGSIITEETDPEIHKKIVSQLNQYLDADFKLDFNNEVEIKTELAALQERHAELMKKK